MNKSRSTIRGAWVGLAALGAGVLAAMTLMRAAPGHESDRILHLTAALALPAPAWLLHALTTPRAWRLRLLLGVPSADTLDQALHHAAWLTLMTALPATGMGITLWSCGHDWLAPSLIVGVGCSGSAASAIGLLCAAMLVIARGTPASWRRLGGSGFGPPEMAPLLYAPAFALGGGLLPAGMMAAIWSAAGAQVSATWWCVGAVTCLGVMGLWSRRAVRRLRPHVHASLCRVAEAHAQRSAPAEERQSPPRWLMTQGPLSAHVASAWVRRYPASVGVTFVLAGWLAWTQPSAAWVWTCVGAVLVLYSGCRGHAIADVAPALTWMGATSSSIDESMRQLAARLALPALVWIPMAIFSDHTGEAIAGVVIGAILVLIALRKLRPAGWGVLERGALALLLAAALSP